ncbi:unnamed protein product [Nesidiocoris tenuis]|uniref:Uncharacterized protein n=1 Tax=Nesidiocoris tenuis TaxID=355587 RepID=A0A6H5GSG0_9HEMI|nr:unnamed protein product [Nesidiocoris tenuis]
MEVLRVIYAPRLPVEHLCAHVSCPRVLRSSAAALRSFFDLQTASRQSALGSPPFKFGRAFSARRVFPATRSSAKWKVRYFWKYLIQSSYILVLIMARQYPDRMVLLVKSPPSSTGRTVIMSCIMTIYFTMMPLARPAYSSYVIVIIADALATLRSVISETSVDGTTEFHLGSIALMLSYYMGQLLAVPSRSGKPDIGPPSQPELPQVPNSI